MSIFALHIIGPCGTRRADAAEFLASKFELQIKMPHGWHTIATPRPDMAAAEWEAAKRRWRTFRLRVTRDGKRIHGN